MKRCDNPGYDQRNVTKGNLKKITLLPGALFHVMIRRQAAVITTCIASGDHRAGKEQSDLVAVPSQPRDGSGSMD